MSTTSLPSDSLAAPQPVAGASAVELDQIEAQIKALKEQALATQAGIDKLHHSSSTVATTTATPHSPSPTHASHPQDWGIWFTVGCVVLLLGLIWAFFAWLRRGYTHPKAEALETAMPELSVESEFGHFTSTSLEAAAQDEWLPLQQEPEPKPDTQRQPNQIDIAVALAASASQSSQLEVDDQSPLPQVQWDSFIPLEPAAPHAQSSVTEAVANEVVRVRNLLADKRKSRSLSRQKESIGGGHPVDVVIDMLDGAMQFNAPPDALPNPHAANQTPSAAADATDDLQHEEAMETDPGQLLEEPPNAHLPARVANSQNPAAAAWDDLDLELDFPTTPDYEVRLALAQESEALGLWQEARELAMEVLECNEPALKAQAKALLNWLDQQQLEI